MTILVSVCVLLCILLGVDSLSALTRIIGGSVVTIEEYPYTASFQDSNGHVCGCAIIKQDVVISAAHCIRFPAQEYKIRAGSTFWDRGGVLVNVTKIIIHPDYDRVTGNVDISLIFLSTPLTFSSSIQPIALPIYLQPVPDDAMVTVTGWGTTTRNDYNHISSLLKSVSLPIINRDVCISRMPPNSITKYMICAGSTTIEEDACAGDSGGPMALNKQLIGIVSWSLDCANPNDPGVYTNVAETIPFINSELKITQSFTKLPYFPLLR